jgi:inner membrane transporter RhtA
MAFLQLIMAMISSQIASAMAKTLFAIEPPQDVLALRLFLAASLLSLLYRPWRNALSRTSLREIGLAGVSLFLLNGLFYLAIQRLNIGIVVALEFVGPLSLAIVASRRWLDLVWTSLAALGLTLLFLQRRGGHTLDTSGAALSLAAGFAWAAYIVFGRRAGRVYGPGSAAPTMIAASLLAIPFATAGGIFQHPVGKALAPIAAIAFLSSAVPVSLEMSAMPKISARSYSIFMCLSPALATLAAWIVAHELPDPIQSAAIGFIIVAAAGSTSQTIRHPSGQPRLVSDGRTAE